MLSRFDLWEYQQRAVEFIKNHEQCALWVDMGLGKTTTTLTAFKDLKDEGKVRRMLVVAPLRVARKVWSDEIDQWSHLHGLSISRIVGTPAERIAALHTPSDIHTINREQMVWLENQFIKDRKQVKRWPWDITVLDESQSFKSGDSQRFKAARRLRRLMRRVVTLTGTPAPNGLTDLWAQYFLLDQGKRLGATQTAFRNRWFEGQLREGYMDWRPRETAALEIQRCVADITLALRAEDYLDLPPVKNNFIRVALDASTYAKYKRLEKDMILEIAQTVVVAANAGVANRKLLQLANGAVYDSEGAWHPLHDAKLDALVETLEFIPGKALIGYAYRHDFERMAPVLDALGRRWAVLRTDESFERWAAGEYDIGVLHPASAGHGLNDVYKSGAEDLIWFGLTDNLELYQQLNARLTGGNRRAGRNVVIHHIVCDRTVDEKLIALLSRKDATQSDLTRAIADYAQENQ